MNFYIITEPEFAKNYWNFKYMAGLRSAVREYKGTLVALTADELHALSDINSEGTRTPLILNGRSPDWITSLASLACDMGFHPILLASHNQALQRGVSSLRFDFYGLYSDWLSYLSKQGFYSIALVGVSKDNISDTLKQQAFNDHKRRQGKENNRSIYCIESSLQECLDRFLRDREKYDAILCTNDVIAIVLTGELRKRGLENALPVHSFWDSPLSKYVSHGEKQISLDYNELGRQAIKLYAFLNNNQNIESISADVRVRLSTDIEPQRSASALSGKNIFMQDECAKDVYTLETLFSSMDEVDLQIISGILAGDVYEAIADRANVSLGTIKYRMKKMMTLAQKKKREELISLITKYLNRSCIG